MFCGYFIMKWKIVIIWLMRKWFFFFFSKLSGIGCLIGEKVDESK